jgi:hypothetical protein
MSLKTDEAILKMMPVLTHVEIALLMALSQAASDGVILSHGFALAIQRVGLSEEQADRVLSGLSLHGLAHLQRPAHQRPGLLTVKGEAET